jgi:RNA polymerase sigma-70 factor (ECF subfamily)
MEPIRRAHRLDHVMTTEHADEPPRPSSAKQADFEDFYRVHRHEVFRAQRATIGDSDLAGEATDEAFARAYARWRSVSRMGNPPGWVYRVAINWSRDVMRSRRRYGERTLGASASIHDPEPCPEVGRAINRLTPDQRAVVVLRLWLDWSEADVASALGIARGTVKSRLSRALDAMRTEIGNV